MTTAEVETPVAATSKRKEAAPAGRDAHGRFSAGNAGGPGNPFARRTAAMRRAFAEAVSLDDLSTLARQLMAEALKGDKAAAKLVLQYTLGKPGPAADPDRLDVEEWQHYKEQVGMMGELPRLLRVPAPDLPLDCVRAARPAMTDHLAGQIATALADPQAFYAAEEAARRAELDRFGRQSAKEASKYGDFAPDETGLPPDVRPIAPKANGKNAHQRPRRAPKANEKNGPSPATAGSPAPALNRLSATAGVRALTAEELMSLIRPESATSDPVQTPQAPARPPSRNVKNGELESRPGSPPLGG